MSNRNQPLAPTTYHDDTTDVIPPPFPPDKPPHAAHSGPLRPKSPPNADILEHTISRFQNLMKELNRTPIREQQMQAIKRINKIKKQRVEEPKPKRDRVRQIEIRKPVKAAVDEPAIAEGAEHGEMQDLFARISKFNRGANRCRGVFEAQRGARFLALAFNRRVV